MVLVHTEEELFATEEPAVCVIGATSYERLDSSLKKPIKVYIRVVRINETYARCDDRFFNNMMQSPTIGGAAYQAWKEFHERVAELVFGKDGEIIGRYAGILILARSVEIERG